VSHNGSKEPRLWGAEPKMCSLQQMSLRERSIQPSHGCPKQKHRHTPRPSSCPRCVTLREKCPGKCAVGTTAPRVPGQTRLAGKQSQLRFCAFDCTDGASLHHRTKKLEKNAQGPITSSSDPAVPAANLRSGSPAYPSCARPGASGSPITSSSAPAAPAANLRSGSPAYPSCARPGASGSPTCGRCQ